MSNSTSRDAASGADEADEQAFTWPDQVDDQRQDTQAGKETGRRTVASGRDRSDTAADTAASVETDAEEAPSEHAADPAELNEADADLEAGENAPAEPQIAPLALIGWGALLGVFAVYTITWLGIVRQRVSTPPQPLVSQIDVVQLWVTVAAPALWIALWAAAIRGRRTFWTIVWAVVGIVLLAPWPVIVTLFS